MDYKINNDKIRLNSIKQIVNEVKILQKSLNAEGYDLTFDQVFKLYQFNEISEKLEDLIPTE